MLIISTRKKGVDETKKYLFSQFKMKDFGELDTILVIKVHKHSEGFALSQSHYVTKILNKFQHLHFKEANTPYDVGCQLENNTGRSIFQLDYASAIGSLMYVMHCNIAFLQTFKIYY